jgi:adenosylcobinamide-GDP ribazoletransferase
VKPSDLLTAFTLLTRLPLARFAAAGATGDLARCVWAFPVVGLIVGALGGLAYYLGHAAGLPPWVAACWSVTAMLMVTGALHEDGLADTADGLGGGATRDHKLEIMRDSRIGSYGALALTLSLLVRVGAVTALATPGPVFAGLVAAGVLGRGGILLVLLTLRPAREDGLGVAMRSAGAAGIVLGLGLAVVSAGICLPIRVALACVIVGSGAALAMAMLARRQLGGYTGDVLGATEVLVECAVLTVVSSMAEA